MEHKISVAEDFTSKPGARYYSDGPKSGQAFYDEVLKAAFEKTLNDKVKLIVDLDGTEGYATSFLDEAFRRLSDEYDPDTVWNNLRLISEDEPDWIDEIKGYIYKTKK